MIYSRLCLDVLAWVGLVYSSWTPVTNAANITVLISTILVTLATCGPTSRWPVTFPMAPFNVIQLMRRIYDNFHYSSWICFLSILLVLISIILSILFPPLQMPKAQAGGPYAVGAVNFFVPLRQIDGNTKGVFDHTHVQARLLYPTNNQHWFEQYYALLISFYRYGIFGGKYEDRRSSTSQSL